MMGSGHNGNDAVLILKYYQR